MMMSLRFALCSVSPDAENQAIPLQLYVWSSRPGRSFMFSGTSDIHMRAGSARE
jgi:hypothetical protein